MEAVYVPIIVALISGPLMWLLFRFDKRNTEQHGRSMDLLKDIHTDVEEVKDRLNDHIDWHLHDQKPTRVRKVK